MRSTSARSPKEEIVECKVPRFAVWGGRMNLRQQVEPLLSIALQASSEQRHAQHATSQLTWVIHRLRRSSEDHHEQSRSLRDLNAWVEVGQGALSAFETAT